MKLLNIIALFLGCRLGWIWLDLCGADLGIGETLPFCLECSGLVSILRLLLLVVAIGRIYRMIKYPPEAIQIQEQDIISVHTIRIHWHRIALLLGLITYSIWISWIDSNTTIPGPDELFFTRASCLYPGVKGTLLWAIELVFIVWGFKILHRS